MIFKEELLISLGAELLYFEINEMIFAEGQKPNYYYQIKKGIVKFTKDRENGAESILNIFHKGQCFGESFLFSNKQYPFNAVAMQNCEILRISSGKFIDFIKDNTEFLLKLYKFSAERTYYRYVMLNYLSINDSALRIRELLNMLKEYNADYGIFSYEIPFTRQQISSITALRLETVIRTVKKMEKDNILQIKKGKIFY